MEFINMNKKILALGLAFIATILSACSSAPRIALSPDAKKSIQRIAIVETPEPEKYYMNPGQVPGGAALYMFGALGGAILGGIEVSRFESATSKFNSAVSPLHPELSSMMLTQVASNLSTKGYSITRVPMPQKSADGKRLAFENITGEFDAVLYMDLSSGYSYDSGVVAPRVGITASLYKKGSSKAIFAENYLYNNNKIGAYVWIQSPSDFSMPSIDAVYDKLPIAVDGMRDGVKKIAEHIAADI